MGMGVANRQVPIGSGSIPRPGREPLSLNFGHNMAKGFAPIRARRGGSGPGPIGVSPAGMAIFGMQERQRRGILGGDSGKGLLG